MPHDSWVFGPIGIDTEHRVTVAGCRTVLVVIPNITAGTRLLDLVALLEGNPRIQVLFTVPGTTDTWHGVDEFAARDGRLVIPWHQALHHRFDLVLAAGYAGLELVHGPILVVPHGASSLMSRRYSPRGGPDALPHPGLSRGTLMHRGRILPAVLALTHDRELAALRRSCPEALPRATVAGDICLDRMVASHGRRAAYRRALDVHPAQTLVTVSSTWGPRSTFGRHPELCRRLLADLRGTHHRVALVLHPMVWQVHGSSSIRGWLAPCVRAGLRIIPPDEGWQATMIASDVVIGDFGSTTQYAAAIGRPVTLAAFPAEQIRDDSLAGAVASAVPRFDPALPALPQLRRAARSAGLADRVTARPGRAAAILRRAMYAVLRLPEPDFPATAEPFGLPHPLRVRRHYGGSGR